MATKPTSEIKSIAEQIQVKEGLIEAGELAVDISVDGLAPWSYSKAKVLAKCPFQFYLKYILKIKTPETPISLITEVGKAAHRILEFVIGGKDITRAYNLTRKEFLDTITDEEWAEHVDTLHFNISKFQERMQEFDVKNKVKRFFQEIKMGVTRDFEPTGFFADNVFYRSVIDLIIQLENGDILIIDHKTGAPSITGTKNYRDQLNTYKIMFHYGIEKVAGAQSGIHFIRDGEVAIDDYSPAKDIEGKLFKDLMLTLEGAVDGVKDKGFFKHIAGTSCKYCEYAEDCKAGKLKDIEKKTVRFFKKD